MNIPHKILIEYLSKGLTLAFKSYKSNLECPNKSSIDWNFIVSDDFIFSTTCFNLANKLNINVHKLSQVLAERFYDPLNRIKKIQGYSGYINFIITDDTCYQLLYKLQCFLEKPADKTNLVQITYNNNTINHSLLYRINTFLKAKENIYRAQGYQVKLINYSDFNSLPFIDISFNYKHYRYDFLQICNNRDWPSLLNNISTFELAYLILSNNSNKSIDISKNLSLNTHNSLYLTHYIYNNECINNLFKPKTISAVLIIKKLLIYPLKVELCSTGSNFKEIFCYLNSLTRLTFEYDLWQNCTEKTSFNNTIQSVIKHCIIMLLK